MKKILLLFIYYKWYFIILFYFIFGYIIINIIDIEGEGFVKLFYLYKNIKYIYIYKFINLYLKITTKLN